MPLRGLNESLRESQSWFTETSPNISWKRRVCLRILRRTILYSLKKGHFGVYISNSRPCPRLS